MCLALGLVASCAPLERIPLNLPPRDATLDVRVAAYRARAATPQQTLWQGTVVRVGDAAEPVPLYEARRVLENAPEAEAIFEARERRRTFDAGLTIAGGVVMLTSGGLALFGPVPPASDERLVLSIVGGVGAIAMLVGLFMNQSSEADSTRAVSVYNRWLWDALALPREPLPPLSPARLAPTPPGALPSWMFGPAPASPDASAPTPADASVPSS